MRLLRVPFIVALSLVGSGCEVWSPPIPSFDEYGRGLIVMYPGSFNTTSEMSVFYSALREAGVDQAIEVIKWSEAGEHFLNPSGFLDSYRPRARSEAARIAAYQAGHPGMPVTLLGFSGGAMAAIVVTEEMPPDQKIDCVILLSPGVSSTYDLNAMLEKTKEGAVAYWSPHEAFTIWLAGLLGTVDGVFERPAGAFGFVTQNPKLRQVEWDSSMLAYGNDGEHLSYLLNGTWIRTFVAPWIAHPHPSETN